MSPDFRQVAIRVDQCRRILGQHRVAEAINRMRELSHNRRVDAVFEACEDVDRWLDFPAELFEHQVLVLHLGAELCGLEQAIAVPHQCIDFDLGGRERRHLTVRRQIRVKKIERCGRAVHIIGGRQIAIAVARE